MNLPPVTARYDRSIQTQINLQISLADNLNHKKNQDIEVGDGRIIMKSANGTRYKLVVSNSGTLTASTL